MKTLKNYLLWILLNGIAAGALYMVGFGPWREIAGCVNLFKFMCWFWVVMNCLLCPLSLISSVMSKYKPEGTKIESRKGKVPLILSIVYDIAFCFALAYLGWFILAAAWFLHMFAQCMIIGAREYARQVESGEIKK